MQPTEEEIRTRSLAFLFCLLIGLPLTPLSLGGFHLLLQALVGAGLRPPSWLESLLGLTAALLPLLAMVHFTRRWLHRRYPHSASRKVPEAWER